jgi:hypothetical protein
MESLENQNIEGKKGNKNLTGFLAGATCIAIALTGVHVVNTLNERAQVRKEAHEFMSALDKNKDGILSASEIKVFYDKTGLSPYTTPINSLTRDQWKSFLKSYGK